MTINILQRPGAARSRTTLFGNAEPKTGANFLRRDLLISQWWGGAADESGAEEKMIKWVLFKRMVGKNNTQYGFGLRYLD